jgi:F-type H+-transporting ATPase subunit epsilon
MAEDKVAFELVAPEALVLSRDVEMVVVPGAEGDFGVLPRHTPMISNVRPGVLKVYENGQVTDRIFVAGGFAEVTPTRCTVLADEAAPVAEIDRSAAESAFRNAQDDLRDAKSDLERRDAERRAAVSEAKLKATES